MRLTQRAEHTRGKCTEGMRDELTVSTLCPMCVYVTRQRENERNVKVSYSEDILKSHDYEEAGTGITLNISSLPIYKYKVVMFRKIFFCIL